MRAGARADALIIAAMRIAAVRHSGKPTRLATAPTSTPAMNQSKTIGQTPIPTGCDIFQAFGTATTCLHTPTRVSRCAD
jgi:hypothetical protein